MFFHGSDYPLKQNDILSPVNKYTSSSNVQEIEALFEYLRPENIKYPRINCVFLVNDIDNIDNVGAFDDYIFTIDTKGVEPEKSDLAWYTQASIDLDNGDLEKAKESIKKYWNGDVYHNANQSVFEYRIDQCLIIDVF